MRRLQQFPRNPLRIAGAPLRYLIDIPQLAFPRKITPRRRPRSSALQEERI